MERPPAAPVRMEEGFSCEACWHRGSALLVGCQRGGRRPGVADECGGERRRNWATVFWKTRLPPCECARGAASPSGLAQAGSSSACRLLHEREFAPNGTA
ncbi:hypothetical protein MRX96_002052 [Rhipicephalus microplus]